VTKPLLTVAGAITALLMGLYLNSLRRLPTAMIALLLAGLITPASSDVLATQTTKPSLGRRYKEQKFLRLGYTELSGNEAVHFLTGNTIVVRKADAPKWLRNLEDNNKYYFRDADNVIECQPVDTGCLTFSWGLEGNKICLSLPCLDPETPYSANPRVLKAPRENERTGQIGVYIEFGDNVQSIVKGNATVANFTDTNMTAQFIEVSSKDFASEIQAAKDRADANGPTEIRVKDPRAASVMIGNTFMTDETATDNHENVRLCPHEGFYYSPDGRLIQFQCREKDKWTVSISRWTLKSGMVGIQDDEDPKKFVYGGPIQNPYLVPSGKSDLWHIAGWAIGDKQTLGYTGNVLSFK
jgi:hypothetical protein